MIVADLRFEYLEGNVWLLNAKAHKTKNNKMPLLGVLKELLVELTIRKAAKI